jgi:signal transduction histidine kinase
LETQEVERRHLARELHDQIGQSLTAVEINLQAAQQVSVSPALAAPLEESLKIIARIQEQVRELSFELRPSLLDHVGLAAALRWYSNQQARRAGFRVRFRADSIPSRVDPTVETACYRVAQEALTNVVRHAQATHVTVELNQAGESLRLLIRDDGAGFDLLAARQRAREGAGLGLLGMEERVSLVGGHLEYKSRPAEGTEILAWFPLAAFSNTSRHEQWQLH